MFIKEKRGQIINVAPVDVLNLPGSQHSAYWGANPNSPPFDRTL